MRLRLLILTLALLAVGGLVYGGLRALGTWGGDAELPGVPPGDQEVAWIHAATSGPAWERFVTGVQRAARDWPGLRVDDNRAFLDQSTAVPEVVLSMAGTDAKLRIRWYKLTSETGPVQWVGRLARRDPPPLAFIGGGSSDRAVDLASALAGQAEWRGPKPLLLITTATANAVTLDPAATAAGPGPMDLMDIYAGRSFRFCFTNRQMATAVVDFVWSQPDLRPFGNPLLGLAAGPAAAADPWAALALLATHAETFPPTATALEWDDDPYSIDLSNQFKLAFHQPHLPAVTVAEKWSIPFSVGGYYRPNAWEADAADKLIQVLRRAPWERQLLVLPAGPAAARRMLRAVTGALPLAGRSLVALSGDSMNVNTVFRDADIAWNIRAVPVPAVFFTHQNPVAWDEAGNASAGRVPRSALLLPPTGTDEVLLHAELVRLLAWAAYNLPDDDAVLPSPEPLPNLLGSADRLAERLRSRRPAYFDDNGDRRGGRGEYVLVLRPHFLDPEGPDAQVMAVATLEVWTREPLVGPPGPAAAAAFGLPPAAAPNPSRWQLVQRLVIDHGRAAPTAP